LQGKLKIVECVTREFFARSATRLPRQAANETAVPDHDRRDPSRQQAIVGGARKNDPPLTTRACADWMGFTPAWIRAAIDEGVTVHRRVVKLEAETMTLNGRRVHRIHLDHFITFLVAIGWKRIPSAPAGATRSAKGADDDARDPDRR
jgi:hypothetical protein